MAITSGSYDNNEINFKDGDESRTRVSRFRDGQVVIRSAYADHTFQGYTELTPEDVEALIKFLEEGYTE